MHIFLTIVLPVFATFICGVILGNSIATLHHLKKMKSFIQKSQQMLIELNTDDLPNEITSENIKTNLEKFMQMHRSVGIAEGRSQAMSELS
jgi:Na+-transporting NADH:ubiquinone oxidoreductase subunit NqrC